MVKGSGNILVPSMMVMRSAFDLVLYFFYCRHDHCPEVFGFENHNLVVIVFALLMVCLVTK